MKTRILTSIVALLVLALIVPISSRAATTTVLLSQDFSSSSFPPSGWTANLMYSGGNSAGWQWSSGGVGGANGSAVGNTSQALDYHCYGSSYGPLTLKTPTLSNFAAVDTQYLDFDLYMPCSYYDQYITQIGTQVNVLANTTQVMHAQTGGGVGYGDATFYDGTFQQANDPVNYPSSSYWRHYHIKLPTGQTSLAITFVKDMGWPSCYYYLWYDDDIAIDNVVITNVHPNVVTVLGPNPLTFGNVPYLQTAGPYYIKLADSSNRPFSLSNYNVVGTNPGDFAITRAPSTLNPGGGVDSIGVTYTPHAAGTRSAIITVSTNDDASTVLNLSLQGFGLRPSIALPPGLTSLFSRTFVRFRQVAKQSFLVTNTGSVPLHIDPASYIGGDFPSQYYISRLPSAPIAPGQSDTITVAFSPTIEGLMTATLFIMSDAQNGTQTLSLRGIGILSRLTLDNKYQNSIALNFDSVNVGADSCISVQLYNPGSDTLAITNNFLSSRDYDFTIASLTGTDTLIAPGGTKNIQVCFKPLKQGFRTATVRITTNIPLTFDIPSRDTSGFTVVFTGEGVPIGKFGITGPSMVDSVLLSHQGCMTDTLWNLGAADITVTGVSLSGLNATEFASSGLTFPFVLAANSHQTFQVCGTPTGMGSRLVTVTANGTTNGEPTTTSLDQSVYGQLVADSLMVQGFPSVSCIGDMADTATIMVMNTGNVSTAYAASLVGADASMFQIVGSSTSSVEGAGGTATFKVVFTPDAAHAGMTSNATFNVTGGAGGTTALTAKTGAAAITGSGTAPTTMAGSTAANFPVTITNNGTCPWTPGAGIQVGAPFAYVSGGTTAIAPGGTGTLTFSFAPTASGTFNQTVSFPNATGVSVPAASVTVTGVAANSGVTLVSEQNGYRLDQNYPNPFGAQSEVEITLPTSANVRLVVLDQKGSIVETVMNQHLGEGSYTVRLEASDLTSGTYYYQMTANDVTLTRQMVIVK